MTLFPWLIVRPTSIWGPWFAEPYRDFFTAIQRGLYMHPRGVRVRRSYGFVDNSVFILDRLTQHARGAAHRRTFYVADYEPVELRPGPKGFARRCRRRVFATFRSPCCGPARESAMP